jgi:hypothetical protein
VVRVNAALKKYKLLAKKGTFNIPMKKNLVELKKKKITKNKLVLRLDLNLKPIK